MWKILIFFPPSLIIHLKSSTEPVEHQDWRGIRTSLEYTPIEGEQGSHLGMIDWSRTDMIITWIKAKPPKPPKERSEPLAKKTRLPPKRKGKRPTIKPRASKPPGTYGPKPGTISPTLQEDIITALLEADAPLAESTLSGKTEARLQDIRVNVAELLKNNRIRQLGKASAAIRVVEFLDSVSGLE